ncbi:MAG: hypothetical protein KG028_08350 [Actinobacteria bacterium]|nr:hypothetical protein [Actinomycetota bacterium]
MRLHHPDAHPLTRLAGEAVAHHPDPPRPVSRAALVRANLTTIPAKIGSVVGAAGAALVVAGILADGDGSGRLASLVTAFALLVIGGLLALALPLRLAGSVARLPAVRARVTEGSFDAVTRDTLDAMGHGMARGVAVLEAHPGCAHQPQPRERRYEVDEGWARQIAPGTTLVALERPGDRLLVVLGIDADATDIDAT